MTADASVGMPPLFIKVFCWIEYPPHYKDDSVVNYVKSILVIVD